jgi:hypothetical protein
MVLFEFFCKSPEIQKCNWEELKHIDNEDCCVLGCDAMYLLLSSADYSYSLMIHTAQYFETSADFYLTTWHHIPEDSKHHSHCHDNSDLTCVEDVTVPPTIFKITWIYGIR